MTTVESIQLHLNSLKASSYIGFSYSNCVLNIQINNRNTITTYFLFVS